MPLPLIDTLPAGLPHPEPEAARHGHQVAAHLADQIRSTTEQRLRFDEWMNLALYAPGLGYYVSGNTRFGSTLPTGDFTTAPELTALFGATLARQVRQVLEKSGSAHVLEFGAGSGALAHAILDALDDTGLEIQYSILEVSPDLQARQRQRLQRYADRVRWLDALPDAFSGCVLANEVLDAMPVRLFRWADDETLAERFVTLGEHGFDWVDAPADPTLDAIVRSRMPALPGYRSEVGLQAETWVRQLGEWLQRGAALLIDYGFPRREYYHPQRAEGTLMCHFRHHAHSHPLILAGLQDITAHVDFTAVADAALDSGLDVLGYTSQARFLLNAGLPQLLHTGAAPLHDLSAVQTLISEAEMGELFKVIALGKSLEPDAALMGFTSGDRRHRL